MRDRPRREHPDARPEVARAPVAHPPDVAAVLRLQALAGNAATSRLLSREPKAPEPERTIAIEGIGTFPLLAFQLAGEKGVSVTLADGPASPRLMQASTSGTPIPSATLSAGSLTLVLRQVLVTSFQQAAHGGETPTVTAELQGASREVR